MASITIEWTWRKRAQVAFLALLVQYQAAREMLRHASPLTDPEYIPAALRIPGESAILAMQPAIATDPSFLE